MRHNGGAAKAAEYLQWGVSRNQSPTRSQKPHHSGKDLTHIDLTILMSSEVSKVMRRTLPLIPAPKRE